MRLRNQYHTKWWSQMSDSRTQYHPTLWVVHIQREQKLKPPIGKRANWSNVKYALYLARKYPDQFVTWKTLVRLKG